MVTLTLRPDQPFNLDHTLSCGQVFRWEQRNGWWYGVVGERVLKVRQEKDTLTFHGAGRKFFRDYFQLDADLPKIHNSIDRDPVIHAAIEAYRGLRIVWQPPWECTLSYLCATYSNIPIIRKRIELLSHQFGDEVWFEGVRFYTFPSPEQLSSHCCDQLNGCKLGYRAPYLHETACRLGREPGWEEKVASLPYEEARHYLRTLKGIGPKAADCILLFAFQKYEAFPVDVWIRRIVERHYPQYATYHKGDVNERIRQFGMDFFGPYAGYAQEYLFCAREKLSLD